MGRILGCVAGLLLVPAICSQEKGGEDETGAYEVVANWPQPWSPAGYIWGSQPAVFAQSPDRIFIGVRGEIKAPNPAPRGFNGSWGSTGQRATEPPAETRNCLVVVDRTGQVIESWTQWDKLFEGGGSPHKIRISPYDPDKHVWVVNDGKHVIYKFTNDGKQLVMTIGETGVPGDDATHFGSPQDLAFLPDGSILVADGLRNARIAKFDKNGKFVSSFGTRGNAPGQLSGVHGIAVGKDGRIYVADRSNRRIQIFDESGKSLDIWPNLRQPNDIFLSDDGTRVGRGWHQRAIAAVRQERQAALLVGHLGHAAGTVLGAASDLDRFRRQPLYRRQLRRTDAEIRAVESRRSHETAEAIGDRGTPARLYSRHPLMPELPAGTRLGPYEILAQIGAGGMGEVYRATDSRLKRQVALKVLPSALTADPDRLARFQREAEVLASLNHPNIAGLYGIEESPG